MDSTATPVMYCLINIELKMGVGKIAAQAGHAFIKAEKGTSANFIKAEWERTGQTKVVLRATERQLTELIAKYQSDNSGRRCFPIIDSGHTQVAPDSLTALAFQVVRRGSIEELESLKLL
jgi:PTH2 family peptidyl-tRNA hydrolase